MLKVLQITGYLLGHASVVIAQIRTDAQCLNSFLYFFIRKVFMKSTLYCDEFKKSMQMCLRLVKLSMLHDKCSIIVWQYLIMCYFCYFQVRTHSVLWLVWVNNWGKIEFYDQVIKEKIHLTYTCFSNYEINSPMVAINSWLIE